jgi:hypothetical protein
MPIDHILQIVGSKPGIARDGTVYDRSNYIDGQWCRFYLDKPRKIGGYILVDTGNAEIVRNMYGVNKQNSIDVYLGRPSSLMVANVPINGNPGLSAPEYDRTPSGFVINPNNQWTFDTYPILSGVVPITLGANPLTTDGSTATVTVAIPANTALQTGDYVVISGATATGGISAVNLNVSSPITVLSPTSFTYTAGAVSTSVATGGGSAVLYTPTNTPIDLANNPLYSTNGSGVVIVTVPSTADLTNLQYVTIEGATGFNSLTTAQLNINAQITILSGTTFSYNTAGTASATGAGGGAGVFYVDSSPLLYIVAVAPPNAMDINNRVEAAIYWGNVNSTAPLTPISTSNQMTSGGIVCLFPYFFKYGNDGIVVATTNPGGSWSDAIVFPIAGSKIVKGIRTRGGSNSPAGLFWSLNSLIRATFVGGATIFQFDTIQDNISIMSPTCVVTNFNVVFWIGIDQFYMYTGVVQELKNDMNTDWFFNNLNYDVREKVWGMVLPRFKEIWWFYPRGTATECSDVLIFNYQGNFWFDTHLGRSAGIPPDFYQYPLMADANRTVNLFNPNPTTTVDLASNPLQTTIGSSTVTVTVPSTFGILTGDMVNFLGLVATGGITAPELNIGVPVTIINTTTLSYTSLGVATSTATGGGNTPSTITYTTNLIYPVWAHEYGYDQMSFGLTLPIDSYFETHLIAFFDQDPRNDRQLRVRRIEQDFSNPEPMTMIVFTQDFAQSVPISSSIYTLLPADPVVELNKTDTINMGRLVSFHFESNNVGGYYQMGKVLLSYAPGDVYP